MANTRLDIIQNKSDKGREQGKRFFADVSERISNARAKARKNNQWAKSHILACAESGEVVTDKEGNVLTLADMSKSWYLKKGSRNNAYQTVKRLKKAYLFQCDVKRFRPKFISLTFAGESENSWTAERAIQKFLDGLRHWLNRCGVNEYAYFWSAEPQLYSGRGALHYHIALLGAPYISKEQLCAWWSHGWADIRVVDDMGRAFKYLAKYLWKWGKIWDNLDVKEDDEVAALPEWWFLFSVFHKRRYGFSKWFSLPPIERIPRWLKESLESYQALGEIEKARRVVGGGWLVSARSPCFDGAQVEFRFESPFKVVEYRA
jgi:hypothetical protein